MYIKVKYDLLTFDWNVKFERSEVGKLENNSYDLKNFVLLFGCVGNGSLPVNFNNFSYGFSLINRVDGAINQKYDFPPTNDSTFILKKTSVEFIDINNLQVEPGKKYILKIWVKNANIRNTYDIDIESEKFPKPFESWIWNDEIKNWIAPIPYPENVGPSVVYDWDDSTQDWIRKSKMFITKETFFNRLLEKNLLDIFYEKIELNKNFQRYFKDFIIFIDIDDEYFMNNIKKIFDDKILNDLLVYDNKLEMLNLITIELDNQKIWSPTDMNGYIKRLN